MNKGVIGIILTVAALGLLGSVVLVNNNDNKQPAAETGQQNNDTHTASDTPSNTNAEPKTEPEATQAVDKIDIVDYAYTPNKTVVKKGTTITWTNKDTVEHTVTVTSGSGPQSELFGKGETFSYTFNEVGTFDYFCEPHPYMKATVEVTE